MRGTPGPRDGRSRPAFPRGPQVTALCILALGVYLVAVWQLNPLVRWLWPIPVVMFVVYPYLKRVTWVCHLWLGASLGLAPVGAWAAVTGELPWQAWALGGAVACGLRVSTSSTRCSTASTTSRWGSTRGPRGSASAACSSGATAMHAGTVLLLVLAGSGSTSAPGP